MQVNLFVKLTGSSSKNVLILEGVHVTGDCLRILHALIIS